MHNQLLTNNLYTLYQRLGGEKPLKSFVERLYKYMETLPEVQEVHAMHNMSMSEAAERLLYFLSGWLGGPELFRQHYGEPRLRRRHLHIPIGNRERDQWLLCAQRSLDDSDWDAELKQAFMGKLTEMANHLRNKEAQTPFLQ